MKNKVVLITILVAVLSGGIGFFAGTKFQQSRRRTLGTQFGNGQMAGTGNQVGRTGFRPVAGEIISSDDKSITVKLQDGSSKIVVLADTTEINKAEKVAKEELKVGEKVSVFGTENSDGSVTAQTIQLNPIIREIPTP